MKWQINKYLIISGYLLVLTQKVGYAYNPELLVGNRSLAYQHIANYKISDKLSLNNISLIDIDHQSKLNNIYFFRNALSYKLHPKFSLNASYGLKNPGAFSTFFIAYHLSKRDFKLNYAIGFTEQLGTSLEHSLSLEHQTKITTSYQLNTRMQVMVNHNRDHYLRGFQQFRIGLSNANYTMGIAANFDQFNDNKKMIENVGLFVKVNFKK